MPEDFLKPWLIMTTFLILMAYVVHHLINNEKHVCDCDDSLPQEEVTVPWTNCKEYGPQDSWCWLWPEYIVDYEDAQEHCRYVDRLHDIE